MKTSGSHNAVALITCDIKIHRNPQNSTLSPQYDYAQVQSSFTQLEAMCKASWEQLKILERAEDKRKGGKMDRSKGGNEEVSVNSLRHRLPKILKDCEERLKVLRAVHRRVINRCGEQEQQIHLKGFSEGDSLCYHLFFKVPLFPSIPGILSLHGEGHQSRGLLQNHQQLFSRVQKRTADHHPAERTGAAEGSGWKPRPRHTCGQEEVSAGAITGAKCF